MKRVVSVMAAFLAMIVPASGCPLVPALRYFAKPLEYLCDEVF